MSDNSGGPGPPDKVNDIRTAGGDNDNNVQSRTYDFQNKYKQTDRGPYIVYVEHQTKNLGRLFPIRVGHFLLQQDSLKNDIIDIKSVGINTVKVLFKTYNIANSLINHDIITKNNFVAYIPKYYNHKKGIVKLVDTFFSEEYLKKAIKSQVPVTEVHRFKRKVELNGQIDYVPRQIIAVTFSGNSLPQHIQINLVNFIVEPYIQPVIQCYSCLRYGHTNRMCKSQKVCKNCTSRHSEDETCDIDDRKCIYCSTSDHSTISKKCPMFKKQHNIKKIMAEENISFKEAELLYNNPSYAKVTTSNRFSILNNFANFPELPTIQKDTSGKTSSYTQRPHVSYTQNKKRKAISPTEILTRPSFSKRQETSHPVTPNPYREDFIKYKENIIENITTLINDMLKKSETTQHESDNLTLQYEIKNKVSSIFNTDYNITDNITISDDQSSY